MPYESIQKIEADIALLLEESDRIQETAALLQQSLTNLKMDSDRFQTTIADLREAVCTLKGRLGEPPC